MLTNIRLHLSKERLNNLLLLRINVPILTILDPNYKSKLVDKTVDFYLNKQRSYHSTKSNTSTSKLLPSDITEKENLFLPPPLNITNHTPASMLLEDDFHHRLKDNDFEGNQSGGNDGEGNSSEDEITISSLSVCF